MKFENQFWVVVICKSYTQKTIPNIDFLIAKWSQINFYFASRDNNPLVFNEHMLKIGKSIEKYAWAVPGEGPMPKILAKAKRPRPKTLAEANGANNSRRRGSSRKGSRLRNRSHWQPMKFDLQRTPARDSKQLLDDITIGFAIDLKGFWKVWKAFEKHLRHLDSIWWHLGAPQSSLDSRELPGWW